MCVYSYRTRTAPGIPLNLEAGAIEVEDCHGTVGRLRFSGETVLSEGRPLLLTPTDAPALPERPPAPSFSEQASPHDPTLRLSQNPSPRPPRVEL